MKDFDLIDSVSFGYREVWRERKYLFKLALIPVLIKLIGTVFIFSFDLEGNYLRQALISLPGLFAEGWLLAQFLRTLLLRERWPIYLEMEPSEAKMRALLARARGIMSSTILYALIGFIAFGFKYGLSYLYALTGQGGPEGSAASDSEPNPVFFFPALLLIYLSIWVFRYMWLYIPVVLLMPMSVFLKRIGGFVASLKMLGIYLVCLVPCLIVAVMLSKILAGIVGGIDTTQGSFVTLVVSVIMETIIGLISTAAMAYSFRAILPKHPEALKDINA